MSFPAKKFLLALLLSLALGPLVRAEIKAGDQFPALAEAGLAGTLPATNGQVVLVDFWASWCAPCKASFPAMAKLYADLAPRGLAIVAVSVDEKESAYAGFVKKLAPPFAVMHDRTQALVQKVSVPTMPTSYLLDRTGKVRFVHVGYHGDATERQLRREIESLLAEKISSS
jgi:thiol-disulfide isomerase/thioredoxin